MKKILLLLIIMVGSLQAQKRIVCLGGTVSEIVYELGVGDQIVGVDVSSIYPPSLLKVPKVGYWKRVSAEGILALKPTHVVGMYDAGPDEALKQLEAAGVKVLRIKENFSHDGAMENVKSIAAFIGKKDAGQLMINDMEMKNSEIDYQNITEPTDAKVLFLYVRGAKVFLAGGQSTPADAMISLSGANNIASDLNGWTPVSSEFFVNAEPDLLILPASGLESLGGIEKLKTLPGISSLKAVQNNNVIVVDDNAFLGFGPRMYEELSKLKDKFQDL